MSRSGPHRRLFDEWSRFYDLVLVQRSTYAPVHDAVVDELAPLSPAAVLDVGCGTGILTARLAERSPAARVVACDFSFPMLQQAARRSPATHCVLGDALDLPFPNGSFDAVVSTESFHWFPDQRRALREFFRVLAPGGLLLLGLVNPRTQFLSELASRLSRLAGEPFRWPTSPALRVALSAAGFRVRAQRPVFRLPGAVLFPAVLTIAERPPGRARTAAASRAHGSDRGGRQRRAKRAAP